MSKEVKTDQLITNINEYEICFSVPNFGFLVKKIEYIDFIDYYGNLSKLEMDKYNVLSNNNKLIFDKWYDEITFAMKEKYCIFGINGKYGAFDIEGNVVIKPVYDKLYYDSDDIFMAKNNNKFGFVNSKNQMTPIIFEDVSFFYEDYAAVRYEYKWGFINKNDLILNPNDYSQYSIAPQYDKVDDFENGKCIVMKEEQQYIIDKQNNIIKQKVKTKH